MIIKLSHCWLFLMISLLGCQPKPVTVIRTINTKQLAQSNFSSFKKIESKEINKITNDNTIINWEFHKQLLANVYPDEYLKENWDYERHKIIQEFKLSHYFFYYPLEINKRKHNLILITSQTSYENWAKEGFELMLYFVNESTKGVRYMLIADYRYYLLTSSSELTTTCEIFSDGTIRSKSVLYECSDVIIDEKTTCQADTIKVKMQFVDESNMRVISRDTVRFQWES